MNISNMLRDTNTIDLLFWCDSTLEQLDYSDLPDTMLPNYDNDVTVINDDPNMPDYN